MVLRIKLFNIAVDPFFLLVLPVMFLVGYLKEFLIIFISILLHELGHIAVARIFGRRSYLIKILPVGLNASIEEGTYSSWRRLIVYISGPFVNILLFVLCLAVNPYYLFGSDNMHFFILVNIYLAVFNMIPISPLDGGRILREILSVRFGLFQASIYLRRFSVFISFLFIFLGIFQFISTKHNFSLILIGIYIIFSLKSEVTEAALMNIKHVIYRRSRLFKKGVYPARDLVVIKSVFVGDIIKHMDFDRFHIIYVLDDDLKVLKVFTEHEIIEALIKNDTDLTFEKLVRQVMDN